MSKKRANPAITGTAHKHGTGTGVFISGVYGIKLGGAYRDRTDDPLLAKQVLSQLS